MKNRSNIIESISFFVILNLIFLGIMAPLASEAHYPDLVLSGFGTATIDAVMSPGEWEGAARIEYLANVPPHDGGGTTPAALFIMNDETNIYIALKIRKFAARGTSAFFEFDNNHNGIWPEEYDVEDIDINTVECNGASAIRARSFHHILIVKFRTTDLVGIEPSDDVVLTVTGNLYDGTIFSGDDTVRIIDPRRHRNAHRRWGNMNRCEHKQLQEEVALWICWQAMWQPEFGRAGEG
jgi:hypothetical protein